MNRHIRLIIYRQTILIIRVYTTCVFSLHHLKEFAEQWTHFLNNLIFLIISNPIEWAKKYMHIFTSLLLSLPFIIVMSSIFRGNIFHFFGTIVLIKETLIDSFLLCFTYGWHQGEHNRSKNSQTTYLWHHQIFKVHQDKFILSITFIIKLLTYLWINLDLLYWYKNLSHRPTCSEYLSSI